MTKHDKNIELYTPHLKQAQIHQALNDPTVEYVTVCSGRQAGKSQLLISQVIHDAGNNPNFKLCVCLPTEKQALKIYEDLLQMMKGSGFVKKNTKGHGNIVIEVANGSSIHFVSSLAKDSNRGRTFTRLYIDEAAFQDFAQFSTVLLPTLTTSQSKKVLIVSTPRGKNWFYNYYMYGQSIEPRYKKYKSFRFTSYDNPHADKAFIDLCREEMPERLFKQEFLGEFVDSTSVFSAVNTYCTLKPNLSPTQDVYIGIDLALVSDNTVVTVMDKDYNMMNQYVFHNVTADQLIEKIMKVINHYRPFLKKVVIESNSLGRPIIDFLNAQHDLGDLIESFYTNNSNKGEIINDLMWLCETNRIKMLNDEGLKTELLGFSVNIKGSTVRYAAQNGFKDDRVMSTAFACYCVKMFANKKNVSTKPSFFWVK